MAITYQQILAAATIAHLLEFIDSGEPLDREAAKSTLKQSGLIEMVKENDEVIFPLRRDGQKQWKRMAEL